MKVQALIEGIEETHDYYGKTQYVICKPLVNGVLRESIKLPCDNSIFDVFECKDYFIEIEITVKEICKISN